MAKIPRPAVLSKVQQHEIRIRKKGHMDPSNPQKKQKTWGFFCFLLPHEMHGTDIFPYMKTIEISYM